MGTVLEMRRIALALGLTGGLAACAGTTGGDGGMAGALVAMGAARSVLGGIGTDTSVSAPRAVPGGFTPADIAAETRAYRLVQVNALGLAEPARVIQENGPEITIALQSGPTAAFDDGVLTATRGFADDLMTLDAPNLPAILRAGGGTLTRRMERLSDQDQILTDSFACTVTAAGSETVDLAVRQVTARRLDESCRGERIIFDNIYWLDGAGEVIASRQYVSPTVAYLRVNRL